MTVDDRSGTKRYEISKFYVIYNILIFAVIVGDIIYAVIKSAQYLRNISPVMYSSIFIRSISGLLCMSFSSLWRIIAVKELSKSINGLSEQDKILEKMSCPSSHDSTTRIIRTCVWTTFLVMMGFAGCNVYFSYVSYGSFEVEWIGWLVPTITQTMDLTILGSLVGWLGCRFRSINDKISDIVTRANTSSPKVIVTSDVCAENLRLLSKAHYNMCAIGRRINRAFNFSVIVIVMTAFIILSTTLYFVFYEVRYQAETNYMTIILYVTMELTYSVPIVVIVIICNWTSGQAMEAGKLIHEVRVETADSLLYDAVKSFSLQLHHQKLEFTGAGFFPLNPSLLQAMAGTITTYLVILIQFEPKL